MSGTFVPGVDPEPADFTANEAIADAVEQDAQPETQAVEEPKSEELATDLAALQEKARVYDIIDSDPNLSQMVLDYMRNKNGVAPDPAPKQPQGGADQQIAAMQAKINAMEQGQKQLLAMIAVSQFEAEHADFKQYKQEVGQLLRKHPTYTLQEAYDQVKATKVGRTNPAARVPSVAAEGRTNRAVSQNGDNLQSIRSKILDPKATKNLDQAFDLALEYARQQHNRGNE